MTKTSSTRYTFEFKQEAVWLAENGQSIAVPARTLGVVDQALFNWVQAHKQGKLKGASSKAPVSAELMSVLCNSKVDGLPGKQFMSSVMGCTIQEQGQTYRTKKNPSEDWE